MTGPRSPRLDCPTPHTAGPHAAPQPVDTAAEGEPTGAARKGVVTAFRSDRFQSAQARHTTEAPTPDRPGLRIYAPPVYRHHWDGARWSTRPGDTPTAAYACACGQTGTATGPRAVTALVGDYDYHRSTCTGTPVAPAEGRAAA
ncbi:hypothetical protein SAMN05428944_4142 [Streptomyces sp. 1222.5]|nr:hypothetical protein BX260_3955 [Streptomyces sp. 5112.2]SEC55142.1 hypothetical protein SAMN05428944_4142 [Streptomyces sp. 1222.5]